MWPLEMALLSKAHSCKQQLVEGLISIKQASAMNSKMTRVSKLKKGSSYPSLRGQCPRYPCKLGKQRRHVGDEQLGPKPPTRLSLWLQNRNKRKENQMAHFLSAAWYVISNHFCLGKTINKRQLRTSQWQPGRITRHN